MNLPVQQIRDESALLGSPDTRPGIAGGAYDTAWLAGVPTQPDQRSSLFPSALQWLIDHQWPDGSWGGAVRYEHDRILSTLAALAPVATFGRRARDHASVAAGTRYLWQHGHLLSADPAELVGFELLLPALVQRAQRAGIAVPPHLDIYGAERAEKLRLLPPDGLYSPKVTVVHSLEFLDEQADYTQLQTAQGSNGALGNSPAATAFYFTHTQDARARAYLQNCLTRAGGSMAPVLDPCETFEVLWAAYHLFLAGVPTQRLLQRSEQQFLLRALRSGGVSLSPSFPIADADDTAVALLLLHDLGEQVDPGVLQAFTDRSKDHFVSFMHERHGSIGVNLHVLHALLRVPGYPNCENTIERMLDYIADQQINDLYWLDKWHISPYYATAHALCVLRDLPREQRARMEPMAQRAREWIRQTQNSDGSWGFYSQPTLEETAYAVLALARGGGAEEDLRDRKQCEAGAQYLRTATQDAGRSNEELCPPLWIDKCLYSPTLIVDSVIKSALMASAQLRVTAMPAQPYGRSYHVFEDRCTIPAKRRSTAHA